MEHWVTIVTSFAWGETFDFIALIFLSTTGDILLFSLINSPAAIAIVESTCVWHVLDKIAL